jgi:hypothetical protein
MGSSVFRHIVTTVTLDHTENKKFLEELIRLLSLHVIFLST